MLLIVLGGLYRLAAVTGHWPAEFLLAGVVSATADELEAVVTFSLAVREPWPAGGPTSRSLGGEGGWLG